MARVCRRELLWKKRTNIFDHLNFSVLNPPKHVERMLFTNINRCIWHRNTHTQAEWFRCAKLFRVVLKFPVENVQFLAPKVPFWDRISRNKWKSAFSTLGVCVFVCLSAYGMCIRMMILMSQDDWCKCLWDIRFTNKRRKREKTEGKKNDFKVWC